MRRAYETTFAATPERVRDAVIAALPVEGGSNGELRGPLGTTGITTLAVRLRTTADRRVEVTFEATSDLRIPYWRWFAEILMWIEARRELRHAAASVRAWLAGAPPPVRRDRRLAIVPPVRFTEEQAARLAALAALATVASFCGALLTQNGDAVVDAFHESDAALGVALAATRAGVLVSLVTASLSDRFGRRRVLLACLIGAATANALTAAAPSFEVFTGAQLLTRAFTNVVLVVAGLAAVEEAPEGARAFALAMFGLAFGAGVALSVVFLPFADLGRDGWRVAFAVSALSALLVPSLHRHVRETVRYEHLARRRARRGRVGEVFDQVYGARFLLLGLAAFLTNMFSAPSSQLTNRYLRREHHFAHAEVAAFRAVTAGVPGLLGVLLAGKLTESRGRRPVGIGGILVASTFQMLFFVGDGLVLWIAPTIAIVAAASGALALGALDAELFPTEVRGTASGFLLVCGVTGAATGLVLAPHLEHLVGSLGGAIALCGVAPIIAAIAILPRVPETADQRLDDVSPSEV